MAYLHGSCLKIWPGDEKNRNENCHFSVCLGGEGQWFGVWCEWEIERAENVRRVLGLWFGDFTETRALVLAPIQRTVTTLTVCLLFSFRKYQVYSKRMKTIEGNPGVYRGEDDPL